MLNTPQLGDVDSSLGLTSAESGWIKGLGATTDQSTSHSSEPKHIQIAVLIPCSDLTSDKTVL